MHFTWPDQLPEELMFNLKGIVSTQKKSVFQYPSQIVDHKQVWPFTDGYTYKELGESLLSKTKSLCWRSFYVTVK